MSDLPFVPVAAHLVDRLLRATDVEGKIPRALEALGPLRDRDVVLLDPAQRLRERQILELGARLTVVDRGDGGAASRGTMAKDPVDPAARAGQPLVVAAAGTAAARAVAAVAGSPTSTGLPDGSADVVLALWSAMAAPCPDELAEAERILRPGGRLLVVQDYGRDDLDVLRDEAVTAELVRWSRRDGWYLANGFRIHVVHAFWTFRGLDEAAALLGEGFPGRGQALAAGLRRPRVAHNVAIYHRTRGPVERPTAGA